MIINLRTGEVRPPTSEESEAIYEDCDECDGIGRVSDDEQCDACEGFGVVYREGIGDSGDPAPVGSPEGGFQAVVGEWGERTFPEATLASIFKHLQEELDELAIALNGNGSVSEECADMELILNHLAHRVGFSLHDAAVAKFTEVKDATWETSDRGYRKRVKKSAPVGTAAAGGEEDDWDADATSVADEYGWDEEAVLQPTDETEEG